MQSSLKMDGLNSLPPNDTKKYPRSDLKKTGLGFNEELILQSIIYCKINKPGFLENLHEK